MSETIKYKRTIIVEFDIDETMPTEDREKIDNVVSEALSLARSNVMETVIDRLTHNKELHPIVSKINSWNVEVKMGGKK